MHIHIPTIVWIKFLGVSPQMHILKSNPGVMLSKNKPSTGNRSMGGGGGVGRTHHKMDYCSCKTVLRVLMNSYLHMKM